MAEMDMFDGTRSVERPQFFDGQALFASDLDGVAGFNRSMRWLHNRSLHQPGIGNGYAVSGARGDREARVEPGYALDSRGREIVLLETIVEPVPPVSAEPDGEAVVFDLTVSYPSDDELEEAETREGPCRTRGVVRLRERPVICWVRLKRDVNDRLRPISERQALEIQSGLKIVLARAEVRNCKLDADLSVAERRNARPPERPYVASGRRLVQWDQWAVEDPDGGDLALVDIGLQAWVDTSAAEFRVVPCYSARVHGRRPLQVSVPGQDDVFLVDLPAFVQDAAAGGFMCHVAALTSGDDVTAAAWTRVIEVASKEWGVTWLGVEE